MKKITAVLQLLLAVMIAVAAMATLFNLVRLVTRPETISVVSAMIGQGLIIICMAALARILGRKAWRALSGESPDNAKPD